MTITFFSLRAALNNDEYASSLFYKSKLKKGSDLCVESVQKSYRFSILPMFSRFFSFQISVACGQILINKVFVFLITAVGIF